MEEHDRTQILEEIQRTMRHRQGERDDVQKLLRKFAEKLFAAFEKATADIQEAGIAAYGKPRRLNHPAGDGMQMLQLTIEDWSLLVVPLTGTARPALKDEAQVPPARFKEFTGRIAVFIGDEPGTTAFYDFLVFADGSWFAWGYGWPRQHDTIEDTDFDQLAYELLLSFGRDVYTVWSTRAETMLKQVVNKDRPAYEFRVLRDE